MDCVSGINGRREVAVFRVDVLAWINLLAFCTLRAAVLLGFQELVGECLLTLLFSLSLMIFCIIATNSKSHSIYSYF